MAKKPKIGFGIGDDLTKALIKALSGAAGKGKKNQAEKIFTSMRKQTYKTDIRGPLQGRVTTIRNKSNRLADQISKSEIARAGKKSVPTKKAAIKKAAPKKKSPTLSAASKEAREQSRMDQGIANSKVIRSYDRQLNLVDVSRKKGQGIYKSTTGKTKRVSEANAGRARSKAGAVDASMAKNANVSSAMHRKLQAAVKTAPDAASRRTARLKLRDFENRTGHR